MAPWAAVLLYLALTLPQLGLPGLHYDEAKEAGVNALEMLRRQNVHAFRSAGLQIGTVFLPLMVQDYIGALNVYLALPFLALFGITVPALRLLPVFCGAVTVTLVGLLGNELQRLSSSADESDGDIANRSGDGSQGTQAPAVNQATVSPERPAQPAVTTSKPGPGPTGQQRYVGPLAMLLLAASPSFVFWSRQGIFVTNVVVTLAVAAAWAGLRWWRRGRPRDLYLLAGLAGLGLWAKLLFVWVLGAMVGLGVVAWMVGRWHGTRGKARVTGVSWRQWLIAAGLFLLALSPLILFNQQTGGTLDSILGNIGSSYYGVENAAFLANLRVRLGQLLTLLRGDHFWYLGGPFANRWAPWIAPALVALALIWRNRAATPLLGGLLFVALLVVQSCFTVSDLFITHYAIVQPFVILSVALAADQMVRLGRVHPENPRFDLPDSRPRRAPGAPHQQAPTRFAVLASRVVVSLVAAALLVWFTADLRADIRYHQALAQSGGLATHSDATYRLAEWLDDAGIAQPLALDWGFEAPVRFLTENRVQPLELFGYERLDAPDSGFADRLAPFVEDLDRLYLLHTPEDTVFQGRRETLETLAAERDLRVVEAATFYERSGRPIYVVVRLERQ